MLLILLLLLLSNSLSLRRDISIYYSRIGIIILLYSIFFCYNNVFVSYLNLGVGLYGGLLSLTSLDLIFDMLIEFNNNIINLDIIPGVTSYLINIKNIIFNLDIINIKNNILNLDIKSWENHFFLFVVVWCKLFRLFFDTVFNTHEYYELLTGEDVMFQLKKFETNLILSMNNSDGTNQYTSQELTWQNQPRRNPENSVAGFNPELNPSQINPQEIRAINPVSNPAGRDQFSNLNVWYHSTFPTPELVNNQTNLYSQSTVSPNINYLLHQGNGSIEVLRQKYLTLYEQEYVIDTPWSSNHHPALYKYSSLTHFYDALMRLPHILDMLTALPIDDGLEFKPILLKKIYMSTFGSRIALDNINVMRGLIIRCALENSHIFEDHIYCLKLLGCHWFDYELYTDQFVNG